MIFFRGIWVDFLVHGSAWDLESQQFETRIVMNLYKNDNVNWRSSHRNSPFCREMPSPRLSIAPDESRQTADVQHQTP